MKEECMAKRCNNESAAAKEYFAVASFSTLRATLASSGLALGAPIFHIRFLFPLLHLAPLFPQYFRCPPKPKPAAKYQLL